MILNSKGTNKITVIDAGAFLSIEKLPHYLQMVCIGYLKKLGGLILVTSIAIWALGYFPRTADGADDASRHENSYIGQIGKFVEPVMEPLGFNWQLSVGLVAGTGAKELVVSTLGVLYTNDAEADTETLTQRIPITPVVALAYMVFVLLYVPCLSALTAVAKETNWKWAAAQALSPSELLVEISGNWYVMPHKW